MSTLPSIVTLEEVMFFDTDCGGVVHNIAYLRMIETARTKLAGRMGMALRDMAERKEFPVVVRTEIDYRKPAVLGDELQIHGALQGLDGIRFWMGFEVRRAADTTLLITCRQQLALVRMPEGKPIRLPGNGITSIRLYGEQEIKPGNNAACTAMGARCMHEVTTTCSDL